jgi:uncharacterized membrane protein
MGTWGNNTVTRMNKTLLVILTVSILANFTAFGFIGVRAAKDYIYHSMLEADILQPVPKEFLDEFQEALSANRWELLKQLGAFRTARDEQHMILTAEIFDEAALIASQDHLRTTADQLMAHLQAAIAEAAQNSPPDVRRSVPKSKLSEQLFQFLDALADPENQIE